MGDKRTCAEDTQPVAGPIIRSIHATSKDLATHVRPAANVAAGDVYVVTTPYDNGAIGSLRWALKHTTGSELVAACVQHVVESHRPSLFGNGIGRVADFKQPGCAARG